MSATNLAGCLQVLAQLLEEGCSIVSTIEPESADEAKRLAMWLDASGRAVRAVQSTSPGLDIDAAHFKLEN